MNRFIRVLKKILTAPLTLAVSAMEDIDMEELMRAVDRRTARAEAAVLKDYFAQHGLEGEDAEKASEDYRARRRESLPDEDTVRQLRQRAEKAEQAAQQANTSAQVLVQMARMGVPESCEKDVCLLVSAQLEASEDKGSNAVKEAVDAVLARLPGMTQRAASFGSRGGFPRQDDGASVWQAQLDRARASGDNAAAVGIITAAAQKGITLR